MRMATILLATVLFGATVETSPPASQPNDLEKAKNLGADDYLVKSQVVIADVIERIRHQLGMAGDVQKHDEPPLLEKKPEEDQKAESEPDKKTDEPKAAA